MKFSKRDAFTIPNILTYIRLLCLPFFLWMMFAYFADREASQYLWAGFGLFVFASATDIADGWIARHFNMVSDIVISTWCRTSARCWIPLRTSCCNVLRC